MRSARTGVPDFAERTRVRRDLARTLLGGRVSATRLGHRGSGNARVMAKGWTMTKNRSDRVDLGQHLIERHGVDVAKPGGWPEKKCKAEHDAMHGIGGWDHAHSVRGGVIERDSW